MPIKYDAAMVRRLFNKTDTDGSGGLDREEIAVLAEQLGAASASAFEEIDLNNNGVVEFDEFYAWYNKFSDQMSDLRAVAEAEREAAEQEIARWSSIHTQRAAEHEGEWQAALRRGRTVRAPKPPSSGGPEAPARRRIVHTDTRVWRLQAFEVFECAADSFNGMWLVDDTNPLVEGKPHFINHYGFHAFCSRSQSPARWVFSTDLTPREPESWIISHACTDSEHLPLGESEWEFHQTSEYRQHLVEQPTPMRVVERKRPTSIGGLGCSDVLAPTAANRHHNPPTAQVVTEYAQHLGISGEDDHHLLWVAEEMLCAPMPKGWAEHVEEESGHIFFRDTTTGPLGTVQWEHPLEPQYKALVEQLRELVREVREAGRSEDASRLASARAAHAAAVQAHHQEILEHLEAETEEERKARRLRFLPGVFAVRKDLTKPVLPPTARAPRQRSLRGKLVVAPEDYTTSRPYIPGCFAAHYPERANAESRLRAEGHTTEDILDIESTLRSIVRSEPRLLKRVARKVVHAQHMRVPARLPPRATALAAKASTARLHKDRASLTAAELSRHLANIRNGEPVAGNAGQHQHHDEVASATETRLEKHRHGTLHMTARFGKTITGELAPMHVAARNGDTDTVAHLLLDGADVNQANFVQQTPLHEAAIQGRSETVDLLLKETGVRTPFFCFCVQKREELRRERPDLDWKARNKELSILWHGTPATNATLVESNGTEGGGARGAAHLSGLWRARGKTTEGEDTEEFLQLDVTAGGVVTGMVDSDGDGVWTEKDCKIAPGQFDTASGEVTFVQIYAEPQLLDVRWSARYDAATDTLTDGQWSSVEYDGTDGAGGTFCAARTTEGEMRNRRQPDAGEEPAPDSSVERAEPATGDGEFAGWDFRQQPEELVVCVDGVTKRVTLRDNLSTLDQAVEALSHSFRWGDEELDVLNTDEGHSVHPTAQRVYYAQLLHISVEDALHPVKMPNSFHREMKPICASCAGGNGAAVCPGTHANKERHDRLLAAKKFFQEEQKYERTVEQGLEELVGEYSFRCVEFRG